MRKYINLKFCAGFVGIWLIMSFVSPLFADFEDGMRAANRGDYIAAYDEWHPLAEQGHRGAQFNLGQLYNKGFGVERDNQEAARLFRLSAEQGLMHAQYNLGRMLHTGELGAPDYAEAFKWYKAAAAQGFALAQLNVGVLYEAGDGVLQSYEEAIKWYRRAASQGNATAQSNLAALLFYGRGVTRDKETAIKWFRLAINQGYAVAQYNLGRIYYMGELGRPDFAEGVKLLRLAADQGLTEAQTLLGIHYLGLLAATKESDMENAFRYLKPAARQGEPFAQIALGKFYIDYYGAKASGFSSSVSHKETWLYGVEKAMMWAVIFKQNSPNEDEYDDIHRKLINLVQDLYDNATRFKGQLAEIERAAEHCITSGYNGCDWEQELF